MKNPNYPIGSRPHYLPACSVEPHLTAPPRTSLKADGRILLKLVWNNVWGSWVAVDRIHVGWIHVAQVRVESETGLMWHRTGCCGKKLGFQNMAGFMWRRAMCREFDRLHLAHDMAQNGLLWTLATMWKLLKKYTRYQDQFYAACNVTHSVWYFHVWSDRSACIGVTMAYRIRLRLPCAHHYGVSRGLQRYTITQEGISIVVAFLLWVSRLRIHLFWFWLVSVCLQHAHAACSQASVLFFTCAAQISPLVNDLALRCKNVLGRIFGSERGKLTKG